MTVSACRPGLGELVHADIESILGTPHDVVLRLFDELGAADVSDADFAAQIRRRPESELPLAELEPEMTAAGSGIVVFHLTLALAGQLPAGSWIWDATMSRAAGLLVISRGAWTVRPRATALT